MGTNANLFHVGDQDFDEKVLKSSTPVIVDFWAAWCGPCRMIGPFVEQLAKEYEGRLKVGKVNVDEKKGLATQYGVRGIPTLAFFKDGNEIKRMVGAQGKGQIQEVIDEIVK